MPSVKNLILSKLIRKILNKFQNQYQLKYQKKLPIILITGTVGKSSTTLLINQFLTANNYLVYSGTTTNKNYNSLAGLGMTLIDYKFNLEGGSLITKSWKQIDFLIRLVWNSLFKKFNLKSETVLVYELGFDHQDESEVFKTVFKDVQIDILAATNLTYEHNQGFQAVFNQEKFELIKDTLPTELKKDFQNQEIDPLLRNTALEQLSLTNKANLLITPDNIGKINNTTIYKYNDQALSQLVETKGNYGSKMNLTSQYSNQDSGEPLVFDSKYLLPITFAKNLAYLKIIGDYFKLSEKNQESQESQLINFIQNLELPNGRFGKLNGIKNTTLIDSSYNSDPAGLNGLLDSLKATINHYKITDNLEQDDLVLASNHYLILGEMRELGDDSISYHKQVLDTIKQLIDTEPTIAGVCLLGSQWLKCDDDKISKTDENVNLIRYQKQTYSVYQTAGQIAKFLQTEDNLIPNSWIWIKGSQNTIFLEIVTNSLLKDLSDSSRLCRRGDEWDQVRERFKI